MTLPTIKPEVKLPTHPYLLVGPDLPFMDRDLSWLQFNERVLAQARTGTNPLMERAKFLGISASNLDEFFMIRFASMNKSIAAHERKEMVAEADWLKQIQTRVLDEVGDMGLRQRKVLETLAAELRPARVLLAYGVPESPELDEVGYKCFCEHVLPHLPPPEAWTAKSALSLGNLQLAAILPDGRFVPLPKGLPTLLTDVIPSSGDLAMFFLDHLIQAFLARSFHLTGEVGLIRLTRDADLSLDIAEESGETLEQVVKTGIGAREKRRPVRLQSLGAMPNGFLEACAVALKLDSRQVFNVSHSLLLHALSGFSGYLPDQFREHRELFYPPIKALIPAAVFRGREVFETLQKRDLLLHHPYDSFDSFVSWVDTAGSDPQVTGIELTVYRTDAISPVISILEACGRLKKVRVLIELRARFDELNNLKLAERLREAGVEVGFGFGKLKLHAKVALVTRMEEGVSRFYTHLSTGNYNSVTARQYTDLAILTANQEIGADARLFFDSIWEGQVPTSFKKLVSAPARLHRRILQHIETETVAAQRGDRARIVAKVNALVDETIIQALYRASSAGVQVDLNVRGACSLIPGVPGLSENIRVISIVDRFLEHSRLYFFENAGAMYFSSADWMPRNFFSRLELAFPVLDPKIHAYIRDVVIPTYFADNAKASQLTATGVWVERAVGRGEAPFRAQGRFQELALLRYHGTPLEE